jgi:hypothetical protein
MNTNITEGQESTACNSTVRLVFIFSGSQMTNHSPMELSERHPGFTGKKIF